MKTTHEIDVAGKGKPEVSRNLDDVFRGLALGVKFQGTSVDALGQRWVERSFLILGVFSVLLVRWPGADSPQLQQALLIHPRFTAREVAGLRYNLNRNRGAWFEGYAGISQQ